MTRINLIDPAYLSDKHLLAEYRELPRIFTLVKKLETKAVKPWEIKVPTKYVLGPGHVTFFYNKLLFLRNRYSQIFDALRHRGINVNIQLYSTILSDAKTLPAYWHNDYQPTPEEIYLNMSRICKQSKMPRVLEELNND